MESLDCSLPEINNPSVSPHVSQTDRTASDSERIISRAAAVIGVRFYELLSLKLVNISLGIFYFIFFVSIKNLWCPSLCRLLSINQSNTGT